MKYFGGVKHGLRNNQLDLGSNADRDPVPWFLNDSDPEFFKRLYLLLWLLSSAKNKTVVTCNRRIPAAIRWAYKML